MQKVFLKFLKFFRCNEILATPTGGKLEMKDGVHIRRKAE
jgi:ribosomal protein S27E